ncbi:HlyD family secretion protein [Microvirga arsenatis]|uniref:HlyD family efflux transporter periplasmic adaptor subunit n=1 Tax=Microvirga arsenatis TaxID=2692265 RepID=A0ABW9Z4I9_9HYPH|nr:efflux RND transporter periplasmic adaptor subunit [Microvirga arsenatis]NBJ13110.1 HlyD family efflux transporter periplasmic adaptor subunit [Microvirga arsenatis]NBJ26861.1 HlyD family efflux transporter periplasmic adaptor subunit [Microvirga arsenatis]
MNLQLHRLDPYIPDPVESRRSPAGRVVRLIYALGVLSVIGFFVVRFGAPAVMLSGPGVVSAPREIVSLPYIVQVQRMEVEQGAKVRAGTPIALVRSPQVNETRSNITRAIADLTSREADLRVKARIARDTLDAVRSRLRIADDTLRRFEASSNQESASLVYRTEVYRERAQAIQNVVALESEAAEASTQLSRLAETRQEIQAQLERLDKDFDGGRVLAPVTGIIATRLTRAGETVVAGSSIAEIFQAGDIYIDWYIPDFRLVDPQPGQKVFVVLGKTRALGTIDEVLPISDTFDTHRGSILREPPAGQVARVRLDPGVQAPALNSRVYVHMYYTSLTDRLARAIVRILGLD